MADIFISYKREEKDEAKMLANALAGKGYSVWWDPQLRAGEIVDDEIEKELEKAGCVIVLWSKQSVNSDYVKAEARHALELKKLLPVMIDNAKLPFRFADIQTEDLVGWDGKEGFPGFEKLLSDLRGRLKPKVQIFWDPNGFTLNSIGTTTISGPPTDGDTPYIKTSVRMLSIDAPVVHYPGNSNPSNHDSKLADLASWIQAGDAPIRADLAEHLVSKLSTGTAGTLQKSQGDAAKAHFQTLLDQKLTKPNGSKRQVFLRVADEPFDQYGRLLAYMSPYYSAAELEQLSYKERSTFNLLMLESGWAATCVIYPNLPKYRDLVLLLEVAKEACIGKKGAWSDASSLTGYEFRMCYNLWEITKKLKAGYKLSTAEKYAWIERYCADMTTRQIYEPQNYIKVEPYNRIFIHALNVKEAVTKMNLVPSDLKEGRDLL